jgi:serine/threonine-protein kinase
VETARKLCAGLTAAHDRGVIHRDLKPQNIMINKRGEVVIMDFGLAAISDQLSGTEVRNGTPAYMAPEQLKGSGVTARSDIYSLGLVLYELFTGKRPYEAASIQQLIDLQDSVHLSSMTSVAADIDPAVEKVIRRCLDPDPSKRPHTALAVAAALPGGDPLAAALAAEKRPLRKWWPLRVRSKACRASGPCSAWCSASSACSRRSRFASDARQSSVRSLDRSPDVLAHQSRTAAESFGYTRKPADSYVSLEHRWDMVEYLRSLPQPRKWGRMVCRRSTGRLDLPGEPKAFGCPPIRPGHHTESAPAHFRHGDRDPGWQRQAPRFSAVPYDAGSAPVLPETVFRAAGLEMAGFTETTPENLPTHPFDQWHAWKGPHPKIPQTELLVEIASWKGRSPGLP